MAVTGEYSQQETQFLQGHYIEIGPKGCAEKLDRTMSSVYQKAAQLDLRFEQGYADEELEYIRANYADKGPLILSEEMDRSQTAIRNMAVRLGLRVGKEARSKTAKRNRGKWTDETRKAHGHKMSERKGPLSPSWKGGVCTVSEMIRGRLYTAWTKYVFQRDNYTCRLCGKHSETMVAHHVKTFAQIRDTVIKGNPELDQNLYEDREQIAELVIEAHTLNDGVTLCRDCHKNHHLANGVNCGDLLTGSAEDNPQPSLGSNSFEGSTTNARLLPGYAGESNSDTSAPLLNSLE
ncbi:MAG: hypothetical protein KJ971_08620 [Firmicutes bacterium]|nr:hypothetical protein [Bacillota bacterium]